MPDMNYFIYAMPVGRLCISANASAIVSIEFGAVSHAYPRRPSALTNRAATQLEEYFAGKRTSFDLPLQAVSSQFQQQVYTELQKVAYAQTKTYAEIARALGKPNAYRAVGLANNKNPLPIVIPCHRIIASNGELGGYSAGLKIKQYLLDLERYYARLWKE